MKKTSRQIKAFSVSGVSTSGKTTVIEELIKELSKRGYIVGTIKSIGCGRSCARHRDGSCDGNHDHNFGFTIDTKGKNSNRHKRAGAYQITTWAKGETAIIHARELNLYEIIEKYDCDYIILEAGTDYNIPRITTGLDEKTLELRLSPLTFAISGKVADELEEYKGIKSFKTFKDIEKLADLVEEKVFPVLALRDKEGCNMCGMTCRELSQKILAGEKSHLDCLRAYPNIKIDTDDQGLKEELRRLLVQLDIESFPKEFEIKFNK